MNTPNISIVITTFNAGNYVRSCFEFLDKLEGPPIEVVVVDDGSVDDTPTLLEQIAAKRDYVRIILGPKVGRAKALNIAINSAKGSIVAINDIDDASLPSRVAVQAKVLECDKDCVAVVSNFLEFVDELPESKRDMLMEINKAASQSAVSTTQNIDATQMYRGNRIVHSSLAFRKSAWREIGGYNESLASCVDFDFYFRLLRVGGILLVPQLLVLQRASPSSFFKRRSEWKYWMDYWACLRFARDHHSIPITMRIYDLKPIYYSVQKLVRNFLLSPSNLSWRKNF